MNDQNTQSSPSAGQITLSFLTKPDCHLCDRLLEIMKPIVDEHQDQFSVNIEFFDIRSDPALFGKYRFRIPVVIDTRTNRILFEGRPDPAAVQDALQDLLDE